MSEFKLPHVDDLATDSKLPGMLTEDMKVIQKAVNDLQGQIDKVKQQNQEDKDALNGIFK